MKTSKFLIAENPLIPDGRLFIVHTRKPFILAEAHHFKHDQIKEFEACQSHYNIGVEFHYPGALVYIGVDSIGQAMVSVEDVEKIIKLMGDWYYAYLENEFNNP